MPKWTKKADIDRILRVARRLKQTGVRFNVPDKYISPESFLSRDCPVCGSADKTHIGEREIQSPTPKGWYTFQHHDVICDACEFHYSTDIPEAAYIDDYYRHSTAYAGADYNPQNRIKVIKRLASKDSCVLEYGSGRGEFVKLLREVGYDVDGVDIRDDIPRTDYDLICCYYTLEHLVFPNDALKMFRGLLSNSGVLIVEVPDFEKNYKAALHFQHFNHFTESHLTQMLVNNGFECIETINAHSRGFGIAIVAVS